MTFVITEPCRNEKDRSCVEVCPEDCIYDAEGWDTLRIHPGECTDCTLCVEACPVQAIYPEAEVPVWWRDWIAVNYRSFGLEPPAPTGVSKQAIGAIGASPARSADSGNSGSSEAADG